MEYNTVTAILSYTDRGHDLLLTCRIGVAKQYHAYVEFKLRKISQLYRPVLMMTNSYRSQQLGLCYSTMWNILRKDLVVKPFKIQLVQELKPNVLSLNSIFDEWAFGKLAVDPLLHRKIVFNDGGHGSMGT